MSMIYHPATGIDVGDPDSLPLEAGKLPSRDAVIQAASTLILSASGWRKVFAAPRAGDERASWSAGEAPDDSLSIHISPADTVLAALMARTFGDFILRQPAEGAKSSSAAVEGVAAGIAPQGGSRPSVLLGIDSRPTGPAIADVFARVLLGMGIGVRYCFIVAAPEIMAFAGKAGRLSADAPDRIAGFAYISASHNPPGHNGVKFGLGTGGVLNASQIAPLIAEMKAAIEAPDPSKEAYGLLAAAKTDAVAVCFEECGAWKRQAVSAYTLFTHEVVTGETGMEGQADCLDQLAEACEKRPLGIVAELNGSARSLSIDRDFFEGLSIRTKSFNDQPRLFGHRIVPEGASLSLCTRLVGEAHAIDPAFQLGYVPDCDGDRGNLVFYDKAQGKARILEAQEVFSLSCLTELAALSRASIAKASLAKSNSAEAQAGAGALEKVAVVVNDATSMRIERIAGLFGASVFRSETGEANVVNLAEDLRQKGWTVRILGEGSNGGTITHPSRVRDPLSTLGAMIRLLRLPDLPGAPSLFRLWLDACGKGSDYADDYDLADVIATLPAWVSTSVFEDRAALRVKASDKVVLKTGYRDLFLAEWEKRKAELERRFGIASWRAFASNGTAEKEIGEDFAASGQGGLRIVFSTSVGSQKAFLWMRGSGTEPVFRIMADIEGGDRDDEEYFLSWHAGMVRGADR
ncbi:MAG TPA: hypothetical protein VN445_13685 [Rectinemataceae bacterium]|nr:hypothetical protein [Rectinemataceae bacterium]